MTLDISFNTLSTLDFVFRTSTFVPPTSPEDPTHIHFYTLHLAFAPDTIDLTYRTWRTSKLICVSLVYTQNPARQVVLSVCCRHATDSRNHSRLRSHARGWAVEGTMYAMATCKITVVVSWSLPFGDRRNMWCVKKEKYYRWKSLWPMWHICLRDRPQTLSNS